MTNEEFNKKLKGTKLFSILVSFIFCILLVLSLVQKNYFMTLLCLAGIVCFILFYNLTKRERIAGPIIGLILGVLYIVSFVWTQNVLSIVLGIVVIVDSYMMLKYIRMKKR